jgi:hypothetical protein
VALNGRGFPVTRRAPGPAPFELVGACRRYARLQEPAGLAAPFGRPDPVLGRFQPASVSRSAGIAAWMRWPWLGEWAM